MSTLKINAWLDSGANIYSRRTVTFEIDKEEWETMSDEEKDELAKIYAWGHMDWGWSEA